MEQADMNDAAVARWLSETIERWGLTDEFFSKLGYQASTVRQYRKSTVHKPADLIERVEKRIEEVCADMRVSITQRNESQFSRVQLSIYDYHMPTISLMEMSGNHYSAHTPKDAILSDNTDAISQSDWIAGQIKGLPSPEAAGAHNYAGANVVAIMGYPGAGKTTELKRLLLETQTAKLETYTCIFVPLAIYGDQSSSSGDGPVSPNIESIFAAASCYYLGRLGLRTQISFESFLERECEAGRLILFLDSLDEAPASKRYQILLQVGNLTKPRIFITSRYVQPRLDGQESPYPAQAVWHLAGLDIEGAKSHVQAVIEGCEARFGETFSDQRNHLNALKRTLAVASAKELTRSPIFLNLAISLTLARGPGSYSVDELVLHYVNFLLGAWARARSEAPDHSGNTTELKRLLGLLAFNMTMRESMNIDPPTTDEATELARQYFSGSEAVRRPARKREQLISDLFEQARTSQLISTEDGNYVKFASPGDVLREFLLSEFLTLSTSYHTVTQISRLTKISSNYISALDEVNYSSFIGNPNLRFLQRGVTLYLRSLDNSSTVDERTTSYLIDDAFYTPPMILDEFGISQECVANILPINHLLLANSFDEVKNNQRDKRYNKVHESAKELHSIFLKTDFESVYRALQPTVWALSNRQEARNETEVDLQWRSAETFDDIRSCIENSRSKESLSTQTRRIQLRRIAYQMRYCKPDNGDDDWAWEFYNDPKDQELRAASDVMLKSIERLRGLGDGSSFSQFADEIDAANSDEAKTKICIIRAYQNSLSHNSNNPVSKLIENILTSDSFHADDLGKNYASWNLIYFSKFKNEVEEIVKTLSDISSSSLNSDQKMKFLIVVSKLADHFDIRQALMPERYRLNIWKRPPLYLGTELEIGNILNLVGAPAMEQMQKRANQSSDGGDAPNLLQPYDFSAECLWKIFAHGLG